MSTDQRTVVITGSTRGIGRALVERLVGLGHTVVGCGRSPIDIEAVKNAHGEPHRFDTEMLCSCWGDGAASSPSPDTWAERAAAFFLALSASDNGKSLSVA